MIIIVFGLAASGKTYVGKLIQKHFHYFHADADPWLTDEMKTCIAEGKLFTFDMLEDFTKVIIARIEELRKEHKNLVITQALYRTLNRDMIKDYFVDHPEGKLDYTFIQVDADDGIIYERVANRGDWVSPDYAKDMRVWFQPMDDAFVVHNHGTGDENLIEQLLKVDCLRENQKSE